MACVVSPFDQRFPVAADEVSMTLPPSQKVVVPVTVTVGLVGMAFTVTVVASDSAELQVPLFTLTVKVPDVETVIDCVVAPFDHVLPVADDEVNTTLPPVHKVVDPDAVIVGVAGNGFTVTVTAAEAAELHPPLL